MMGSTDAFTVESTVSKAPQPMASENDSDCTSSQLLEHHEPAEALQIPTGSSDPLLSLDEITEKHHILDTGVDRLQERKAEQPIIFFDPLGAKWRLPFENVKTWEGMITLISSIFKSSFHDSSWDSWSLKRSDKHGQRPICITLLPDGTNILPELWEQMVQPGWQVCLPFKRDSRLVQGAIKVRESQVAAKKGFSDSISVCSSCADEAPGSLARDYIHDGLVTKDMEGFLPAKEISESIEKEDPEGSTMSTSPRSSVVEDSGPGVPILSLPSLQRSVTESGGTRSPPASPPASPPPPAQSSIMGKSKKDKAKKRMPVFNAPPPPPPPPPLPPLYVMEDSDQDDTDNMKEISYVARIYQQDEIQGLSLMSQKTYANPVVYQLNDLQSQSNSVLREVRNVFRSVSKRSYLGMQEVQIKSDDVLGTYVLDIRSGILLDALKATMTFSFSTELRSDEGFQFRRGSGEICGGLRFARFIFPFSDLYWHREELKAYRTQSDGPRASHSTEYNENCDHHLDILLRYLEEQPAIGLAAVEAGWSRKVPVATFRSLWMLLKPGTDVYVREKGQLNAYVVEGVDEIAQSLTGRVRPYQVTLWNLDFDGRILKRSVKTVQIEVFEGEREVISLQVFPTRFHEDKVGEPTLRHMLIERGRSFVKFANRPILQEYTGKSEFHPSRKFNQVRVIVDHTNQPSPDAELLDPPPPPASKPRRSRGMPPPPPPGMYVDDSNDLASNWRVPRCGCKTCAATNVTSKTLNKRLYFDDYDNILPDATNITEHQYLLCTSHVWAFMLQDRFWDFLDIRGLTDARVDRTVIDTLVMRPERKSMIKAICETYSQRDEDAIHFAADYIRGKGEGQIILLHGPPGTGKTLTAESVAEYTEKPLLTITGADLGENPYALEKNLLQFFRNATKWDAIVLIDEADIYLERRSVNDLHRNSIVSVFLRALDYFQGILFLTTNRVGTFDEAFMSRIHIQIGFDPLDDDSRRQIWTNSFKRLAANHKNGGKEIRHDYSAKDFITQSKKLQDLKWNGREIRNAFQTAVTLASYEAKQKGETIPTVTDEHLGQVVDMSTKFKEYMKSALQYDDSDFAYINRLRDDRFQLVPGDGH